MADLSALFQSIAGGGIATPPTFDPSLQGAPDPTQGGGGGAALLQALQAGAGGGQAPPTQIDPSTGRPTLAAPPTQAPVAPPTPIQTEDKKKSKTDDEIIAPYQANAAKISQEYAQLKQQTDALQAKLAQPISTDIPPELRSFDKYNEQRYQETYGGGGKLGTAGRALANFLSGGTTGKSIRETLTSQDQKDWQLAIQQAGQRIQAEKSAQTQTVAYNQQRLAQLTADARQNEAMQKAALDAYKITHPNETGAVKPRESTQLMTGEQVAEATGKTTYTTSDGKEVPYKLASDNGGKTTYYVPTITPGIGVTGARESTPPQYLRVHQDWAKGPDGQWEQISVNGKGEILGSVKAQPPSSIVGSINERTEWKTLHDLDGREYLSPVIAGSSTQPANQGPPKPPPSGAGAPVGPAAPGGGGSAALPIPPGMPRGTINTGGVKPTADIQNTRAYARTVLPHLEHVDTLIDNLDKSGDLGPIMSRWNDFMSGKVGTDPTKAAEFTQLKEGVGLVQTALGKIHGGAKGGGSIQMMQRFEKYMAADHMDAETLKGAIKEARLWIGDYAHLGETPPPENKNVDLNKFWQKKK